MNEADRNAMPGNEPTDEDLRHDIELTREELGQTAAELAAKADVKQRASEAAQQVKERASEVTQQVKERASEVTQRGAEPIKRNPGVSVAGALALIVLLLVIRRIRDRR